MEWLKDVAPLLIALIGAGGITGFVIALLRWRPESANVAVTTSEKAVVIQASILEDLQEERKTEREQWEKERERFQNRLTALEAEVGAMHKLNQRVLELEQQNYALITERDMLKARVRHLETEVESLKNGGHA